MPANSQAPDLSTQQEVSRLVNKAREEGRPDTFLGKRRWVRYQLGLRLEVTTGGSTPSDTWAAVMHNISGGGFGFWSRRKLELGDCIFVREWTESRSGEWLPAWVTHSTVGIQGYLIGARFEDPCDPDEGLPVASVTTETSAEDGDGRACDETAAVPGRRSPLKAKCAFASTAAACVAAVAMASAITFGGPIGWAPWLPLVTLGVVCTLGGLIGWVVVKRETEFLDAFCQELHSVTREGRDPQLLMAAPSKELDALRRAFLSMGVRWRQREDDERAQRQKLEEVTQIKSNILSIVSHDLRTPLTSILLYAQMLKDEIGALAEEDQQRFLGIISDECNRLSRLVDDLLEVQRLESDRVQWDMKLQDLSGTIRACARVFEAMAGSKSIEFTVDCPDSLPPTEADADKMSQVLSNLLSNALKYTPNGGKVHLSAEAKGGEILLRVADTGPGIPRDKWDQIFDRFSQLGDPNVSEVDGFGLGLYIVKRVVERHGGAAWVDSGVGRGSEFCVSLPTQAAHVKAEQDNAATSSAGRVLVCDPDPALGAMVAQTLRWEGFEVRVCHSGCRLLAQLSHGDVDVVVTDVLLPDMDATEVLDRISGLPDRSFRLIVHSYAGDGGEFTRRGVDVFLRRPVAKEELLQAIHVAMQKRSAPGLTVLLVEAGGLDTTRFTGLLSGIGHMPLVAEDLEAAETRIRDYSIDAVLLSSNALRKSWAELRQLREACPGDSTILVLCDAVRRRERQLAEEHRVTAMPYRPGSEDEVISALVSSEPMRVTESSL